jgi:hypothetical protein
MLRLRVEKIPIHIRIHAYASNDPHRDSAYDTIHINPRDAL